MNKNKIYNMKKEFIDGLPDLNICLLGLQGSRMLGLAQSEDADYDYRGIYIAPNKELLSLNEKARETIEGGKHGDNEMEYVFQEVEKFFRLAIKSNPSVIHLFFVPKYNYIDDIGREIVANKHLFLSEPAVRASFGGYAMNQIMYLKRSRGNTKRRAKHVRHCFRLFDCGKELLQTGKMTFPLKNPEYYIQLGEKIKDPDGLNELAKLFEEKDREFKSVKSVLDKKPDTYLVNKLLLKIRGF